MHDIAVVAEKVKKLQQVPGMAGVYVLDHDGNLLECSSVSHEALGDPHTWRFLFQTSVMAMRQLDEFDTAHLLRFMASGREYTIVPEGGLLVVAVKEA